MVNSSEPNRKQIEEEHNNTLYQWFLDLGRAIQKAGTDDNPFGKLHSLVSSQQWYIDATKFVFDPPKAEYKHRYVLVLISNLKTLIVNSEVLIQKKDEIVEKQVAEASIRALEEKYLGFKKSIKAQQNSLQKPREASLIALFNISFGIWMGLFVLMLSMGSNVGFAYKVETTANDLAKAINSTFIPTSNMTLNSTSSNTTNHNAEIIADINCWCWKYALSNFCVSGQVCTDCWHIRNDFCVVIYCFP
ncbi:predicted protein [Naegleria gruberi]|uniref:Predicted protein n=1 Tax=Naegleria gruberi TaxID=5762 RepID=D2W584_NAEGR|nr:uncharacterized protein NAEGRDRAFT_76572 [Naegleria gruberi]EFC35766.1 predicted protein [Naegleria gruberi]|eukprot:XP_002668510.1 predicted protein [Naegleria gruberi strain NEG-M]